jgi:cytochrome c oxidase cbb3-type subunit 3
MLLLVGLACFAQNPDDIPSSQAESAQVSAGKAQFAQTCGFCHGRDARGASGPDLIRSSLVNHDVNGNLIGEVIRNGRPSKGMPAFQLSDAEVRGIAAFLHHEATGAASVARRIPAEYPVEKLLVGNRAAGEAFFQSHCRRCHSVTGDLAHLATKYKPFELQARIAFPSGRKPTVIVEDGSAKTVKGEEVYQDEFRVTLKDSAGWTHTFKMGPNVTIEDPLQEHERLLKTYSDANVHDLFAYLEELK